MTTNYHDALPINDPRTPTTLNKRLGDLDAAITTVSAVSHVAVTLATDADVLLGLSTQQITLDPQTANTILSGPTTGAAADPTFRALVPADIPTIAYSALSGTPTPNRQFSQIPEFAGAHQTIQGSSGSGTNAITLTAEYDSTNRVLYYNATTDEAAVQDYDIILQWELPPEFSAWRAEAAHYYVHMQNQVTATPGDTGVQLISFLDTAGVDCLSSSTKRQNDTWVVNDEEFTIAGKTWTVGGIVTLRFRLFAITTKNARLGRICIPWTAA